MTQLASRFSDRNKLFLSEDEKKKKIGKENLILEEAEGKAHHTMIKSNVMYCNCI